MAASHPPLPNHVRHSVPSSSSRPHTHPQLVSRDAAQPSSLPIHFPQSQRTSPPSSLATSVRRPHSSLPVDLAPHTRTPAVELQQTRQTQKSAFSVATLENARYQAHGIPRSEHANEDRHLELEGENFKVFAVFDGHDGPRAAGFAANYFYQYFNTESWKSLTTQPTRVQREMIPDALKEFFRAAEKEFFNSIRPAIVEKQQLQRTIPSDMNSYQAYLTYPVQVNRIQELEPKISGGTTVVLTVICNNTLYVANTGDSRAVLVNENEKGLQQILQLSVDHGVENVDEVKRLVDLGLDRHELERSGRLSSQENTRSIGDYYIKEGYKDVDTLRHCKKQPGSCDPDIDVVPITPHCKYVMLMTDGVYKSVEATFAEKARIDPNKVLMTMVNHERDQLPKHRFVVLADRVVDRIRKIHEDTYKKHAEIDVRSPTAVSCRKRDDITLLIYQFEKGPIAYF